MDMQEQRESLVRRWFSMWLDKQDTGIEELFAPAGGRSTTAAEKLNCGLTSGTPVAPWNTGISESISTREIRPWWSGLSVAP